MAPAAKSCHGRCCISPHAGLQRLVRDLNRLYIASRHCTNWTFLRAALPGAIAMMPISRC
jgi:hypothetical protein